MKRRNLIIFTIAAMLLFGFMMFIGCDKPTENNDDNGGNTPPPTLIGTWNLVSIILEINNQNTEVPAALAGVAITIVVRNDGTFDFTYTEDGQSTTDTGTYTSTSNSVTFDYGGGNTETMTYRFEGQNLLLDAVLPMDLDEDGVDEMVAVTLKFSR